MSKDDAAGRKTGLPRYASGRTEALLEQQIETLGQGVLDSVGLAKALTLVDYDTNGHPRKNAVDDAVRLAKTSAKLARAMARLRGEVSYKFHYSHGAPAEAPPPATITLEDSPESNVPDLVASQAKKIQSARGAAEKFLTRPHPDPSPSQNPRFE